MSELLGVFVGFLTGGAGTVADSIPTYGALFFF